MSKRNLNKVTRANILAHIEVNAAVDDIRALYGAAGVSLAETLVADGYAIKGARNGFAVYHLRRPMDPPTVELEDGTEIYL